jgi:hypothetical protein
VKARRAQAEQLAAIADTEERVLIATGRLHRLHPGKREVIIYDYVDEALPVLARMSGKRIKGYDSLGYRCATASPAPFP